MNKNSLYQHLEYNADKPAVKVVLESDFTKEIRILFKENQIMKEHQTPFPIVVEIVEGEILFGVEGKSHLLQKGDLISLSGSVPHDLKALSNSMVRLTLAKKDHSSRVQKVANQ